MRLVEEGTPNPQGEALVEELRWIHSVVRQNLATILEVSAAVDEPLDDDLRAPFDP